MTDKERQKEYKFCMALIEKHKRELEKEQALERHNRACRWVEKYNLPYRVSLDYLKRYSKDSGVVMINRCYPLPGLPAAELLTMTLEESRTEEGRARIASHNSQFYTWNLDTAAGIKAWEHEFTHYLQGYDIAAFSMFDMVGVKDNSLAEALDAKKRYYIALQGRFKRHTGQFRTEEPPYLPEYEGKYTEAEFIRQWTRPEVQEQVKVLTRLSASREAINDFIASTGLNI